MTAKLNQRRKKLRTYARINDKKRRIKNKKRKYAIYYIFFAIMILSITITLSLTTFFKIENIKVFILHNKNISEHEILNSINLNYGDNLIRFDTKKTMHKLIKQWPSLSTAEIIKKFPNTVEILCKFNPPTFFIENYDKTLIGIAESGRAIIFYNSLKNVNRPIIKIQSKLFTPPKLGEFLHLPQKELFTLQNVISLININNIDNINKIEINEKLELCLIYNDRIKIEIKNIAKIEHLLPLVKEIIINYIGQHEKGTLCYFDNDKNFHFIPEFSYF